MWAAIARAGNVPSIVCHQMKLPTQPMVHGDDGTIDVADQAVAENDVGNFPVTPRANIGQSLDAGTDAVSYPG
jgi:hypothetical protein